jgi:hypothetical protein
MIFGGQRSEGVSAQGQGQAAPFPLRAGLPTTKLLGISSNCGSASTEEPVEPVVGWLGLVLCQKTLLCSSQMDAS